MGRPPSIKGSIMSAYVLECQVRVAEAKRSALATLQERSRDPVHYIGGIGDLQEHLEAIDLALRNIDEVLQANEELPAHLEDPASVIQAIEERIEAINAGPVLD